MKDVRDQWQTYRLSKPYNAGAAHPAALTTCLIELFSARETVSGLFCKFLLFLNNTVQILWLPCTFNKNLAEDYTQVRVQHVVFCKGGGKKVPPPDLLDKTVTRAKCEVKFIHYRRKRVACILREVSVVV